jgi:alpha-L-glutamate ligase-like protein
MPEARAILGMNARNQLYTSLNSSQAIKYGTSKYDTKLLLQSQNIATAKLHAILSNQEEVNHFDWQALKEQFVIKPSNGNAGKGILILRNQLSPQKWADSVGHTVTQDDILLHCRDILAGEYSTYGANPRIIVEERVPIHGVFYKYTRVGTPDIRIIIFNHVPLMGMLRLPTDESGGRANLHQGAIGAGIDMFSGVTTHAIEGDGHPVSVYPGTKKKLNGIKIPSWNQLLITAVQAADAAGLVFCGVDLFAHEQKGPLVVELNANPGLSIQLANRAGLRRRLERVEDLRVLNAEHGAKIGQSLFAETFSDKIKAEEGLKIVQPFESISLYNEQNQKRDVDALVNTGRFRSMIASSLVKELGLIDTDDLLWYSQEKEEGRLPVVNVTFKLKDRKITTAMVVSLKLNTSKYPLEIGRNDLKGFLVGEVQE